MSGITSANALVAAQYALNDSGKAIFTDTVLGYNLSQVVREISSAHPLAKRCNLAIVDNTWDADLSSLTYSGIRNVFYPTDDNDTVRQFDEYGTTLTLKMIDSVPTVTSGTLTGTVTFTINSRSVTGSGTKFTTELQVGYLICKGKVADAAYKWYRVAYITSDTALTLSEPFEEASGVDTVSLTKYRDSYSCIRINYSGNYTVSTSSDMPARWDDLLILGIVAHAATEFASNKARTKLTDIDTDRTAALAVINTVNIGGDVASKYTGIMQSETIMAQLISSYKSWANQKMADYQQGLKNITKFKVHEWGSTRV